MTLAVLAVILTASFLVVGITSLAGRWLERRDEQRERRLALAVQDETDCFAWCFVSYASKNYDDVCDEHLDEIGRELSRG